MSRLSFAALSCLLSATAASAQGPELRLIGDIFGTDVYLLDNQNNVVHTWTGTNTGLTNYVLDNGDVLRSYNPATAPQGYPPGAQGGIERLDFDGNQLWSYQLFGPNQRLHHDIEPMPNGNVLVIAWDEFTPAQATAMGRAPNQVASGVFRPDSVLELQPDPQGGATVVWEWHMVDHVIQDLDAQAQHFGNVATNPQLVDINWPTTDLDGNDWNHVNSVKYDPVHDLVIISSHRQSEIYVIDHSTTSAEAAGHTGGARGKGGDILYRWGNPQVYRAGTAADQQLFNQHYAHFIPEGLPGAGNILLFNNVPPGGVSEVLELVPPIDAQGNFTMNAGGTFDPAGPTWSYSNPLINSSNVSNARRMASGNTLICAGASRRVVEVTPAGQIVWTHNHTGPIFQAQVIERKLWADEVTVSAASGGNVEFDLLAGTEHVGEFYWLLGSFRDTPSVSPGGIALPLTFDPYMIFTLEQANSAVFSNTFGQVDAMGRAQASINLPAAALHPSLAGIELYHACVLVQQNMTLLGSNAIPLKILP